MYPGTVEHRSRPRGRCLIVRMSPGNFAYEILPSRPQFVQKWTLYSFYVSGLSGGLDSRRVPGVHTSSLTVCAFGLLTRATSIRLRDGCKSVSATLVLGGPPRRAFFRNWVKTRIKFSLADDGGRSLRVPSPVRLHRGRR